MDWLDRIFGVKKHLDFRFNPLPDITAYELAKISPLFGPQHLSVWECFEELGFTDAEFRHLEFKGDRMSCEKIKELKESGKYD